MERAKNTRQTLEATFFVTPEQKLFRFLLNECTTTFTPRVLSSKLKGVRGLGGADGIKKILDKLAEIGIIQFVDNNRAICLRNEHVAVRVMKGFSAVCDLEGLQLMLEPISSKGIVFGSRTTGLSRSDSNYDLLVVTNEGEEVRRMVERHPLGRKIELTVMNPDEFLHLDRDRPQLAKEVAKGIVVWGTVW